MDPAVKVEYLPTRYEEYKKGWISGSEVKKVYHKTTIHNTKSVTCRIILTDSLPVSHVDKISVELLEPAPQALAQDSSKISFSSSEDAFATLSSLNAKDEGKSNSSAVQDAAWPNDFVTKNKTNNNIVWFKTVKAGEKIEMPFAYRLEWPYGCHVYISDKE